jgi:hypothetical protein
VIEIISNAEKLASLADNIVARTYEVHSYEVNVTNYEAILENIGSIEISERMQELRTMSPDEAANQATTEELELLGQVQQFDRVSFLVKTEKIEMAKAQSVLDVLISQLPSGSVGDAAIQAAIDRRNSQV